MWQRRTPGRLLAAVVLAAGLGAGAWMSPPRSAPGARRGPRRPAATPTPDGLGRTVQARDLDHVGALFHSGTRHFCSGT